MSGHPNSPIELLAELVVALRQRDLDAIDQRLDHLDLSELLQLNLAVAYVQMCVNQRLWLRTITSPATPPLG